MGARAPVSRTGQNCSIYVQDVGVCPNGSARLPMHGWDSGVESALQYIKTTFDALEDRQDVDRLGQDPVPKALPNNDTFCAVFRGVMCDTAHRKVEPGTSVETYGDVTSAMMKADVTVGPRIMSYGLDLYLMDGEVVPVRPPSTPPPSPHTHCLQMSAAET